MARGQRVLTEGMIAGVIGYAVTVAFFALWNLMNGLSPFHTAGLLGEVLFHGRRDPAGFQVAAGPVLAFNGVHLIVFLAFGGLTAWLASLAERGPQFWYIAVIAFVFVFIHVVGAMVWFSAPLSDSTPAWVVGVATLLAAAAMSAYLWWAHPRLHAGQAETA